MLLLPLRMPEGLMMHVSMAWEGFTNAETSAPAGYWTTVSAGMSP